MASRATDPEVLVVLFAAAYNGNLGVVKSLVKEKGVPVDVIDSTKGSTALHWACFGGNLEVVEWLVKVGGANATRKNKDDRSPLFFACELCHKPVAAFLVSLDRVDVNARDGPAGHAPLHRACLSGQVRDQPGAVEIISWLLRSAGADPELRDNRGCRPGEADLAVEAPSMKASPRADEIRRLLANARAGGPLIASTSAVIDTRAKPAVEPVQAPTPVPNRAPVSPPVRILPPPPARVLAPAPAPTVTTNREPTSNRGSSAVASLLSDLDRPESTSRQSVAARASQLSRGPSSPGSSVIPTTAPVPATMNRSPSPAKKMVGVLPAPAMTPTSLGNSAAPSDTVPKPRTAGVPPRALGSSPMTAVDTLAAAHHRGSPTKGSVPSSSTAGAGSIASRYQLRSTTSTSPSAPSRSHPSASKPSTSLASRYEQSGAPPSSGSSAARYQRSTMGSASAAAPGAAAGHPGSSGSPAKSEGTVRGAGAAPFKSATSFHISAASAGTEAAEAEIAASNAPKASALAAAYEMKARNRQHAPAPRRPDPSQVASSLSKRAPTLSISVSGASTNNAHSDAPGRPGSSASSGSGNGKGGTRTGGRSDQAKPPLYTGPHHAPQMTPEELAGAGSVMKKKQVYVEAAQKGSQASPKDGFTPSSTAKAKKVKEPPSFMEKVVSMFSISPQSSRESSPASRSPSRSPSRSRSRSPHMAAGGKNGGDQPRLGFFHSNLSFKQDSREKE